MAIILSLDCATGPSNIALWRDGKVLSYLEDVATSMQSARLLPMIERALSRTSLTYKDLTAVAATVGPGSFTAIRVALATARGICFAAGIPSIGFTTLEVIAYAARHYARSPEQKILSVLNAGKGEVYFQLFAQAPNWSALCKPQLGTLDAALAKAGSQALIAGNMTNLPSDCLTAPITFPRTDALAELAALYGKPSALTPFYIRPPDAIPNVKNF